jgi:tetratricopeptide (TPR) repeat protein
MHQTLLVAFLLGQPQPSPTPSPSPTAVASPTAAAETPPLSPSDALVAEADAHYARRSIGAIDGVADKREITAAIELYRKALVVSPHDAVTLSKLMRALHFRGVFTAVSIEEKKLIFEEGRKIGQAAVDRLEAQAKGARGLSRIEALRLVKGAPALYLWTAGHWGEWGLLRGKFAAARSGVASRLRDLAQTVIEIDPLFEDAAGYRILGRLHSEAPKIPLITGWISHEKGVQYLRRSYQNSPNHPVTSYFLAEAILDHEPLKRDEAVRLLEQCAHTPPRPDRLLEDARYAQLSRKHLDLLRSASGQ